MGNNHLSAKAEEVYLLRKMLSPFEKSEKRSDKEMRYTSYHAGTMTEARLRYIDARLKAGGYTGIKTINRT